MHYCNICGSGDAYEGLNVVECINQDCKNFTQKQFDSVMALKKKSEDVTLKDAEKNLQKFKEAYGYPIPPINEEVKPKEAQLNAFEEFLKAKATLSNQETFKRGYYGEPFIKVQSQGRANRVTFTPVVGENATPATENPILWLDVDKIEFISPDITNISQYNIDNTKVTINQMEEEILKHPLNTTTEMQQTYWELKKHLKKCEHAQELSKCQEYYSRTGRKPSEPVWQWQTSKGILDLYTKEDAVITKRMHEYMMSVGAGIEKGLPDKAKTDAKC